MALKPMSARPVFRFAGPVFFLAGCWWSVLRFGSLAGPAGVSPPMLGPVLLLSAVAEHLGISISLAANIVAFIAAVGSVSAPVLIAGLGLSGSLAAAVAKLASSVLSRKGAVGFWKTVKL